MLADAIPANERSFNIAVLCVFVSILAHGLGDTPAVGWIAKRGPAVKRGERPAPAR